MPSFIFPQKLAAKPELELLPLEVIAAAGKRDLGFNPLEIEQAIAIVTPPIAGEPAELGDHSPFFTHRHRGCQKN